MSYLLISETTKSHATEKSQNLRAMMAAHPAPIASNTSNPPSNENIFHPIFVHCTNPIASELDKQFDVHYCIYTTPEEAA